MDDYFEWNKQNSYAALINFLPYEYANTLIFLFTHLKDK